MSYKYIAAKKLPLGLWMLDDTTPFQDYSGRDAVGAVKAGSAAPLKGASLVNNALYSAVFSNANQAEFTTPVFVQGKEREPFALEAWLYPARPDATAAADQKVLSHASAYDGLTINGNIVSFSTQYLTTGTCKVSYDIQHRRAVHVVGTHNANKNELYVNGELVASLELTDEQKEDSYVATDGKLYTGQTTSTHRVLLNAVAVYRQLGPDDILDNFNKGRIVFGQDNVVSGYGGEALDLTGSNEYMYEEWVERGDFMDGVLTNVAVDNFRLTPAFVAGASIAGSWRTVLPLDASGFTSIYGAVLDWSGENLAVDVSFDGITWTPVVKGELITLIPNGFNPATGGDLEVRASFAGGRTDDAEYLESISVTGYVDNVITKSATRTMTVSHPSIVMENREPVEYDDRNGIYLDGGTLTIAATTDTDAPAVRTVEVWVKPIAGTLTKSFSGGTTYLNGLADATAPRVGEWSLQHFALAADVTTSITLSGDVIIGQVSLYDTALSAADVLDIYRGYVGYVVYRESDSAAIAIAEPASPVKSYDYDWAITGAGG